MRKLALLIVGTAVFFTALHGATARADDVYEIVVKKQETKKQTGWNLADWLEARDKMRLMDLWLAIHSPSPYEFFVGGRYALSTQGRNAAWSGDAAAYATIFGLGIEDEFDANSRSEVDGLFNLRIFGLYVQSTNITLQLGIRSLKDSGYSYRDALAGVQVAFYLTRHFGLEGTYRHYFDTISTDSPVTISENRYAGGAFIDFSVLRLYGQYYSQPADYTVPGLTASTTRSGTELGVRLFF